MGFLMILIDFFGSVDDSYWWFLAVLIFKNWWGSDWWWCFSSRKQLSHGCMNIKTHTNPSHTLPLNSIQTMQIISRTRGLFKKKRNHALTCCGASWTVWFLKITRRWSWNFCEVLERTLFINIISLCVYLSICDFLERWLEFYRWSFCVFPTIMAWRRLSSEKCNCVLNTFFSLDEKLYEHICAYNLLRPEKYNKWKRFGPRVRQRELTQLDPNSWTRFRGPKGAH